MMRVLIAEDDLDLRENLKELVEDCGFEVRTAPNGAEAFDIALSYKPHLVITDFHMPKLSGAELVKKIKEENPLTFAVILTAHRSVESCADCLRAGADDFLLKPFDYFHFNKVLEVARERFSRIKTLEETEQKHIANVISFFPTQKEAAAKLGVNPATLWRKKKAA